MTIIKNIGKRDRMVADRILKPGDSKPITVKQAELFVGDVDFEITDMATPLPSASPPLRVTEHDLEGEKPVVKKRRGKKR